jgi:hypothetical protein
MRELIEKQELQRLDIDFNVELPRQMQLAAQGEKFNDGRSEANKENESAIPIIVQRIAVNGKKTAAPKQIAPLFHRTLKEKEKD